MDKLTTSQRSLLMSKVKGKNTKIELFVRKELCRNGIKGYRIHYNIPGKPDVAFVKEKVAVFIDGCFWHKCPVCYTKPNSNVSYWEKKVEENQFRDRRVNAELNNLGWTVLRFWEHEVKNSFEHLLANIVIAINKKSNSI